MGSLSSTHRRFGALVTVGLSCSLMLAVFDLSAARPQDEVKLAKTEPKLIGSFSTTDVDAPKFEGDSNHYLTVSDDGQHVATRNQNGALWLWDVVREETERRLQKPSQPSGFELFDLAYLPQSRMLASLQASTGNFQRPSTLQLQLWDTTTGESHYQAEVYSQGVADVPHHWDRPRISVSNDGTKIAVGVNTAHMEVDFFKIRASKANVAVLPIAQLPSLYPPSTTTISVLDVSKKRLLASVRMDWGFAPFALSADGNRLAVWDGSTARIAIYDVSQPNETITPLTTTDAAERCSIIALAFGADGRKLTGTYQIVEEKVISPGHVRRSKSSGEMYVGIWDIESGKLQQEKKLFMLNNISNFGSQPAVALCANGRIAAAMADDKTIRIVDTASDKEQSRIEIPYKDKRSCGVALSRNGRYIAVSTLHGSVVVWDLKPAE
jgi:WD40 repeat protein